MQPCRELAQGSHIFAAYFKKRGMNNVIFLDFDGVLNAFYYPKQLADHGQVWRDRFGVLFAPECIAQLGRIIEATDAQIIISSSWKIPFEGETDETVLNSLKQMWEARQYPGRIDGAIPNLTFQEILDMHCDGDFVCHKGFEIEQWLRQHPECTSYAILDDEEIVLPKHESHFVRTDKMVGLQEEDADRAVEILLNDCYSQ